MASLTHSSRALLRAAPRTVGSLRALSTTAQKKASGEPGINAPSFESPFKSSGSQTQTSKIPDFSHYRSKNGKNSNLLFQYFMVGSLGALTAAGAKATVQGM
jgi:ubiquinol-cytochrome c reductase iron-sulfur subunit